MFEVTRLDSTRPLFGMDGWMGNRRRALVSHAGQVVMIMLESRVTYGVMEVDGDAVCTCIAICLLG